MTTIGRKRGIAPLLATCGMAVAGELFTGGAAFAQTTTIAASRPSTTADNNCDIISVTACVLPTGTRTATTLSETIIRQDAGKFGQYSFITGQYAIDEQNAGFTKSNVYYSSDPTVSRNSGFANVVATFSLKYVGSDNNVEFDSLLPPGALINQYSNYNVTDYTLQSLSVSGTGSEGIIGYAFSSSGTVNASSMSTQIAGRYYQAPTLDGVIYGTLTGTASLTAAPANASGPLQFQVGALTLTETTRLNETGLVTPKIAVTGGIDMGGSAITNLAAGTAASDAVNLAQLIAETTARQTSYAALAAQIAGLGTGGGGGVDPAALAAEITARTDADTRLTTALAGEATARAGADAQLQTSLNSETAARASADTRLATGIDSETSARAAADTAEAGARQSADATLNTMIVGEAATRASADAQLQTGLDTETAARTSADTKLGTRIDGEASARTAADTAETAARQSADTALNAMIADEATIRAGANARLSQRIDHSDAVDNTLAQGLATESAARIAGDAALSARIDSMGTRLDQVDSRLDRLDQKVSSSTAVAVAMGGAAFLPDTRFNLTANVATYDGAQAGAVQFGAMIGPKLAVNAGVASGFNKGGKTAARAGFTIGW